MKKRMLGKGGLHASAIGYGCMGLTGAYGAASDRQDAIAQHATPAQIAIAWLLAQEPWIVPIPGTRKRERLEENLGAASVDLTAADLREIDDAASTITVQGARLPEEVVKLTNR